jgi:RNA polymerase sigma-70 factor (ECF subfamily)
VAFDTLLVKLASGDDSAAEQAFREYEPVLRALVRRRLTPTLRTKFDSTDVVQSAWADLLTGYRAHGWKFADRDHLKAFLARVTFNHFFHHCRRHRHAVAREHPLPAEGSSSAPACNLPRPSEVAQAGDVWETIAKLCPPAHLEVLRLKRQGLAVSEIAARTGLHEGSVRRIVYELARRLAAQREESAHARLRLDHA